MKRKLLLMVICLTLLIVGCGKKENSYKLTLDINPSIEIEVENEKVKEIEALNDDAEELVNKKMKGRLVKSAFEDIIKRAIDAKILDNDTLYVILGTENTEDGTVNMLRTVAKENKIRINVITPDITEEAKKTAEKYDITPAKAAYLLTIIKNNEQLKIEDLKNKSVRELVEMKDTKLYCDEEYVLRDGYCEKAIKEEEPEKGKTCPEGYQKVKDNCYMISVIKHEPTCPDGYELKDGKCIGSERTPAYNSCSRGAYNEHSGLCEHLEYVDGGTVSSEEGNEPVCHNGSFYTTGSNGRGCYRNVTIEPSYSCKEGTLEGNECVIEKGSKEPTLSVVCDKGLTKYKDLACLDYNKTAEFVTGYTCKNGARLEGEKCVYYEVIAAKSK